MNNIQDFKVERIIREDFDSRTDSLVIAQLLDKGISYCANVTDEEIDKIEDNGLMTADFLKALVKTARRIAIECDVFNDILPYIAYRYEPKEEDEDGE